MEGKNTDIEKVVDVISRRLKKINDNAVKGIVKAKLTDSFADILQTLDSKRDRDILEAIIAKITSVESVVSIKGAQLKGSVGKHHATLNTSLKTFKDIKVPITPKIFFCLDEWLCHAEQNDEKIFVFDQNWNFL